MSCQAGVLTIIVLDRFFFVPRYFSITMQSISRELFFVQSSAAEIFQMLKQ